MRGVASLELYVLDGAQRRGYNACALVTWLLINA
jgi:hypothetical protein